MLPKGIDLVSVGEFKAAESRVESIAKDVHDLRGEIGSVKSEAGSIKIVQKMHFEEVMSQLKEMSGGNNKQLGQAKPPLPIAGAKGGGEGDDNSPLGDWDVDTLAAKVKFLAGEEGLIRLLYATKPDLIAALSHLTDVYIVHRDMVAQGDEASGWKVSTARVAEIDARGCLRWGVGAPPEDAFKGSRKWRGDGAEGIVYRAITCDSIFLDKHAAHRGAETVL